METAARQYGNQAKSANHSPLMRALTSASTKGEKVNFCPFGCSDHQISELGHCRHLIGYCTEEDKKTYEPLGPPDAKGVRSVDGSKKLPVKAGDVLERITVSYRVYRDLPPEPAAPAGDESDTRL